jgi:Domain of unknown function (DUF4382)
MSKLPALFLVFLAAICLVSCGGTGGFSSSVLTPAGVPITMSVQDTPPAGVAVLSFQIQITSATLQPSDATKPAVTLLTRPADVELSRLQSEPALLGSLNVPAGSYNGVTVAFANPRMVILNNTGATIPIPGGTCDMNAACRVMPALNSTTVTVSGPTAPFPITLASNSPLGLLLHFDVNSSVQNDLSITPTIDLKKILPNAGVIHPQHIVGTITDVSSPPYFVLQPGLGAPAPVASTSTLPPIFRIKTDNNTKYIFVDDLKASPCASGSFSCLAVGQTVNVTVNVMSDGSLLATLVSLLEQQNEPAFEGTVLKVDAANNQFVMALMGGQWGTGPAPSTNAAIGVVVTVTVAPNTVYEIDRDGFTIPAGLVFTGLTDMIPGQTVEVQALPTMVAASSAANPLPLMTKRVRLDETQVTAKVASIDTSVTPPTAFTIGSLPPLFPAASSIKVQTITGQTQFLNVTGVSGLSVGPPPDTVSISGLLFKSVPTPTLLAEKVLKRVMCTAATATGSSTILPCVMQ